jgi:hypothetical protein
MDRLQFASENLLDIGSRCSRQRWHGGRKSSIIEPSARHLVDVGQVDLFVYNRTYIAKSLGEMRAPLIEMKTVLQIAAALCLIFMLSVIFHKLITDIMALAQGHSGQEFWRALGRYLIENLAG